MSKSFHISSFLPESTFLENKQEPSCRRCFEDCAVADGQTGRIFAARGPSFLYEKTVFPDSMLQNIDFSSPSIKERPVLFPYRSGTAMVLPHFLRTTGLLLCFFFPAAPDHIRRALLPMGRDVCWASEPTKKSPLPFDKHSTLCEQMDEIFFYIDRMTDQVHSPGLWTLCLSIAHFAGCRARVHSLPTDTPTLSRRNRDLLVLFLLCSFLTLRGSAGILQVTGDSRGSNSLSLEFSSPEDQQSKRLRPLFLEAPCFASFVRENDGKTIPTICFPLLQELSLRSISTAWSALFFHFVLPERTVL